METKKLKGKDTFTKEEIEKLRELIRQRVAAPSDKQKGIRAKMRKLGFYGQDDWDITDMQETDLDRLIHEKRIKIQ